MMEDWSWRFTAAERRVMNKVRLRILLVYVVLIAALVAVTSMTRMWSGNGDAMDGSPQGSGVYTTAGAPLAR